MTAAPPPENRNTMLDPISVVASRLSAWAGAAVLALLVVVVVDAISGRLLGSGSARPTEWMTTLVITSAVLSLAAAINAGRLARMDVLLDFIGGPSTRGAHFITGVCAFLNAVAMVILAFAAYAHVSAALPRAIVVASTIAAAIVSLRTVYRCMMVATSPAHSSSSRG